MLPKEMETIDTPAGYIDLIPLGDTLKEMTKLRKEKKYERQVRALWVEAETTLGDEWCVIWNESIQAFTIALYQHCPGE